MFLYTYQFVSTYFLATFSLRLKWAMILSMVFFLSTLSSFKVAIIALMPFSSPRLSPFFSAFLCGISQLSRLVTAEFFCFFIRAFGYFVFGEHIFHFHCFLDCGFAGRNFCQFLVGSAGGEISCPFFMRFMSFTFLPLNLGSSRK